MKHTHIVAGGGQKTHDHDVTTGKHAHPADNLLPFQRPKKFAEHAAVVRMLLPGTVDLAEKRMPFAVTGEWHWDDYGAFQITPADLDEIERNFTENARRQDLPVLNEDHDKSRAIGWVSGFQRVSPDRLDAIVDINPAGERLLAEDQYRYVSPELMRDYTDAETGQTYSLVGVGHAVTNKPRIKALGRIAASESGIKAGVIACSEGPVSGSNAIEAAELLTSGQADQLGDDGDPLPACNYAPPFSEAGRCPGYTKVLSDGDGDAPGDLPGCCALAERCNGYSPVVTGGGMTPVPLNQPMSYSEGERMPAETEGTTPVETPNPTQDPTPEPTPAPAPSPEVEPKNMSELKATNAALVAQVAKLTERIDLSERATKLAMTQGRIDALLAANKITPAEAKGFSEERHLVLFSENESLFSVFDEREPIAVPFGEKGSGKDVPAGDNDRTARMAAAVKEFSEMKKKEGKRATPQEAAAYALKAVTGGNQ